MISNAAHQYNHEQEPHGKQSTMDSPPDTGDIKRQNSFGYLSNDTRSQTRLDRWER